MKCKECKHYWAEIWRHHDHMAVREAKCALYSAPIHAINVEQCGYFERKADIFDKIAALLVRYGTGTKNKQEEKE
jgi:hypothetical protein